MLGYDYGDDNYDSVRKEDCSKTDDISKWVMDSPSSCQLACLSDQACAGWTFVEAGGLCGLYTNSGLKIGVKNFGHVSGLRDSCVSG